MSRVRMSPSKRDSAWRISRESSATKNQLSGIQQSFALPHKFMPTKGDNLNQSKFLNPSLEKSRLSSNIRSHQVLPTPRRYQGNGSFFLSDNKLKQSGLLQQSKQEQTPKKSKFKVANKDSLLSISEDQFGTFEKQAIKHLSSQYQNNRRMILQVKEEFRQFKEAIMKEISNQRDMVLRMVDQISLKINIRNPETQKIIGNINCKQNEIMENLHNFCDEKEKNMNIEGSPFTPEQIKASQPIRKTITIGIPQQDIITNNLISPKAGHQRNNSRDTPDLAKCNHIVETINTLNEINDSVSHSIPVSPIARSKQAERKAIQDYKQKIQEITKRREDSSTLSKIGSPKSSYKLDKFYSAIDKLKQQINQIKQISDLKQTKSGRVIKSP